MSSYSPNQTEKESKGSSYSPNQTEKEGKGCLQTPQNRPNRRVRDIFILSKAHEMDLMSLGEYEDILPSEAV